MGTEAFWNGLFDSRWDDCTLGPETLRTARSAWTSTLALPQRHHSVVARSLSSRNFM
jgi:hypothetical protein